MWILCYPVGQENIKPELQEWPISCFIGHKGFLGGQVAQTETQTQPTLSKPLPPPPPGLASLSTLTRMEHLHQNRRAQACSQSVSQ